MLFTFDTDAHLQHLLMTGANKHREMECYNVYQRNWVQMNPFRGLLYEDYKHSRLCIVRECGMGDEECQGIGRAVRKCHRNLITYESVSIQLPTRYAAQAPQAGNSTMPYISDSEDDRENERAGG